MIKSDWQFNPKSFETFHRLRKIMSDFLRKTIMYKNPTPPSWLLDKFSWLIFILVSVKPITEKLQERSENICTRLSKLEFKLLILQCNVAKWSIPPRSPDINPIENLFHLVRSELGTQAITEKELLAYQ